MSGATQTLRELLAGLEGCHVSGDDRHPVPGVAYHSQEVVPGGVFVALKGNRTDGHRFRQLTLGGNIL